MDQPGPHISVGGNVGGHVIVGDKNIVGGAAPIAAQGEATPPAPGPLPVHRTIICVDVESFGDKGRTDQHRGAVRDGLYMALRTAFDSVGIRLDDCYHEDRGDGALILVDPEVPKALLATRMPQELAVALAAHNALYAEGARIRARLSLHAGEVALDPQGIVGSSLIHAFRILDAKELKAALRESTGTLAVIVSSTFFDDVIQHAAAAEPGSYRQIRASVKETKAVGWIRLFGEG
jgi:hypothetical protein